VSAASKLRVERAGPVLHVALASPPLNVLDIAMLRELAGVLESAAREEDPPHVVVVRGDGAKAFSAGASVPDHAPDRVADMLAAFHRAIRAICAMPPIAIAAVHGHCLGGGLELAAACDLAIVAESATFSQPEIDLGCFPPAATAFYPSLLGSKRAAEIVLLGGRIDAARAEAIGLVNAVVPDDTLDAEVARWAAALATKSRAALAIAKRALRLGVEQAPAEALAACERLYLDDLVRTDDMREGIAAFLEKRKPVWRHR
jgi:cyclohexa-1,5-dienecarbonyl-CoA hydratase